MIVVWKRSSAFGLIGGGGGGGAKEPLEYCEVVDSADCTTRNPYLLSGF